MNGHLDWMVLNISEVFVGLKLMTGGPVWILVACLPVAKNIMNPRLLKVLHGPHSLNYYLIIHVTTCKGIKHFSFYRNPGEPNNGTTSFILLSFDFMQGKDSLSIRSICFWPKLQHSEHTYSIAICLYLQNPIILWVRFEVLNFNY